MILLGLGFAVADAQAGYEPVEEAGQDPSLMEFKKWPANVVARKDTRALEAMRTPEVRYHGQGTSCGIRSRCA